MNVKKKKFHFFFLPRRVGVMSPLFTGRQLAPHTDFIFLIHDLYLSVGGSASLLWRVYDVAFAYDVRGRLFVYKE